MGTVICAREVFFEAWERKQLLIMDGYSCHVSFKKISLLKENDIIVVGLPAHTSHALQPLDVPVFWQMKQEFKRLLSRRTVYSKPIAHTDIFTICELSCGAYQKCLTETNTISGFRRAGLWSTSKKGCDPTQIRAEDSHRRLSDEGVSHHFAQPAASTPSFTVAMNGNGE